MHGRDRYFRPNVILDTTKLDLKIHRIEEYIEASIFFMHFIIEYMLIPGKVENWVNVIDMGKQGLRELPLKAILKFVGVSQKIYKCRLGYSFVLNPPSSIYYIWTCAKPFIDKATQSKVIIENKGYSELMLGLFEPGQVEERFGGTAPNLTVFWPPVFPPSQRDLQEIEKNDEMEKERIQKKHSKKKKKKISIKSEDESIALLDENFENESGKEIGYIENSKHHQSFENSKHNESSETLKELENRDLSVSSEIIIARFDNNSGQMKDCDDDNDEKSIELSNEIDAKCEISQSLEKIDSLCDSPNKAFSREIIDMEEPEPKGCGCRGMECCII